MTLAQEYKAGLFVWQLNDDDYMSVISALSYAKFSKDEIEGMIDSRVSDLAEIIDLVSVLS